MQCLSLCRHFTETFCSKPWASWHCAPACFTKHRSAIKTAERVKGEDDFKLSEVAGTADGNTSQEFAGGLQESGFGEMPSGRPRVRAEVSSGQRGYVRRRTAVQGAGWPWEGCLSPRGDLSVLWWESGQRLEM